MNARDENQAATILALLDRLELATRQLRIYAGPNDSATLAMVEENLEMIRSARSILAGTGSHLTDQLCALLVDDHRRI